MVWLASSFARSHAAAPGDNDDAVRQTYIERTVVASYFAFDAGIDGNEAAIAESARRGLAPANGKAARAMSYRLELH